MGKSGGMSDYVNWLGAGGAEPKDTYVAVFVPSKTRDEQPLDHEYWRDEAMRTMSTLFGGATAVAGFGGWLDQERGGKVKEEQISMVFSFIAEDEWNKANVLELRKFLHRMGREAEQGEIGVLVKDRFLRIRRYDDG